MSVTSPYAGKRFSIIGDSISTLKGFLPPYCKAFYMQNPRADCSGIARTEDTWWAQVISALQGDLCVNNSYSGGLVCGMDFPAATHLLRCGELHCNPGAYWYPLVDGQFHRTLSGEIVQPDVVLIAIGTNDWLFRSDLHDHAEPKMNFGYAYPLLLQKIQKKYPDALIVCSTLFQDNTVVPNAMHPVTAYNDIIRQAALEQDCLLAELAEHDQFIETIDGIHPTYQGMHTLAQLWIRAMSAS